MKRGFENCLCPLREICIIRGPNASPSGYSNNQHYIMAEAFGIAGSAVGVISLAIQVTQGHVQYYGSWKDAKKDVLAICKSAQDLDSILQLLDGTLKQSRQQDIVQKIEECMSNCVESVTELETELDKVKIFPPTHDSTKPSFKAAANAKFHRALYPFLESTIMKLRENLDHTRNNVNLALEVLQVSVSSQTSRQLGEVAQDVGAIAQKHKDTATNEIIEWLSSINSYARQREIHSRRQPGIGLWLF